MANCSEFMACDIFRPCLKTWIQASPNLVLCQLCLLTSCHFLCFAFWQILYSRRLPQLVVIVLFVLSMISSRRKEKSAVPLLSPVFLSSPLYYLSPSSLSLSSPPEAPCALGSLWSGGFAGPVMCQHRKSIKLTKKHWLTGKKVQREERREWGRERIRGFYLWPETTARILSGPVREKLWM